MKRFAVIAVVAALLLVGVQCEAIKYRGSRPPKLYGLGLDVCQDKVVEWKNASTDDAAGDATPSSGSPSSEGRNSSINISRTFMRGKWKLVSAGNSAPVVRPSFLAGDKGRFDFYSMQMGGLRSNNAANGLGPIRNISGHVYLALGKDRRPLGVGLNVGGVFNSLSGEVCMVACLQRLWHTVPVSSTAQAPSPAPTANGTLNGTTILGRAWRPEYSDADCGMRVLFTIAPQKKAGRQTATGTLESLIRNASEAGYFTELSLAGKMVDRSEQRSLYLWNLFVKAIIFAVEAVVIMWQIFHSIRSPSSYFVSMLMIIVQIAVMCFLSIYLVSVPLRLMTLQTFKYLLSSYILVPWLALTFVILLNTVFLLVILRKRRVAKRLNVAERPQEVILAMVCLVIYAVTSVALWSAHNFEAYVQVVWCWFLLPQVVANVFWDLRLKPLHWAYVVGVSLCRIAYIGFNAARPTIYGLDDMEDFPHGWFWGITGTVIIFASYALLQQYYGGRCFLPQRWFGYQLLATSKPQARQEEMSDDEKDTMLDL